MSAPEARRLDTRYLSAEQVAGMVRRKGLAECIAGVASYLRQDFLRWNDFDKCARVATHSEVGVIELMPVSDARSYAFKYVNGHPSNHRYQLPTVMAFGVLADVETGTPELVSELTLTTAIRTAAMSAVAARALARLYNEEQFGPVVPVVPFDEVEAPIRYVTESSFGQQVSIFGADPDRIAALIDFALEALGLFPGGGDRPIRPRADGEAAFPRLDPICQDEGARPAAGDPDTEADHLLVIDDDVLRLRLKPFHAAFGEMRLHAFDPFRSTQPRSFPVSKMLSAGLPMNGGNGRKPGRKGRHR